MPRPPRSVGALAGLRASVFAPTEGGEAGEAPVPLHIGDTWLEPLEGARIDDIDLSAHPGLHRYTDTRGLPELVDAVVEKLRARNGLACERDQVLVAAGATGGLAAVVGALAEPGEEVLILAPYWPLIRGIVQGFRATPVEVPFYDRVDSPESAVEAVRERITPRSVALYVSTPSNPTGRVVPRAWLEALAELARREGLWIVSDEVYEDLVYTGEHFSIGRAAPERTLSVFSFSKAYAMAGNRTGYLTGPAPVVGEALKVSTHTVYSAPTAGQLAGCRALRDGADWLAGARERYRQVGASAAAALGLPAPEGGTFLFLDVAEQLDERGIWGFLADCVADGVALAPGPSCGAAYESWVRLCFTAVAPPEVERAVARLARRIGG